MTAEQSVESSLSAVGSVGSFNFFSKEPLSEAPESLSAEGIGNLSAEFPMNLSAEPLKSLSVFSLGSLSIILELLLQQSDTVSVLVVVSYSFPAANPTLPQRGPLPSPIPQSPLGEGLAKPVFASLEDTELALPRSRSAPRRGGPTRGRRGQVSRRQPPRRRGRLASGALLQSIVRVSRDSEVKKSELRFWSSEF